MTEFHYLSDRYELGKVLGLGGMSEVHRARDTRLNREVAIKVLRADLARDPGLYLRFRREAQHAAALDHSMIVAIYDTGEVATAAGPLPYIVMEYVDGVTLRDMIHCDGPTEAKHAIEVVADACQALGFSHQQGIVHRDVKPANIMISTAGAVKVKNFGIARTLADTTGAGRLTQTAAILGTAAYLSPEQASGETVDARSDVYSLGCVLYELLIGVPPFHGDTPLAVADQQVCKDPVPPSRRRQGISADLDAVVLKSLAKNPENRYQSAAEMRTDLIRVHSGQTPKAPKVFTDADRTNLLTSTSAGERRHLTGFTHGQRGDRAPVAARSLRRWLLAVAATMSLVVVGIAAVNSVVDRTHSVRVPDLHGQNLQNAVATLKDLGFKIRGPIVRSDAAIPAGRVIGTDPVGGTTLGAGDEVTINISSGPK